jgi:hypothetical protein
MKIKELEEIREMRAALAKKIKDGGQQALGAAFRAFFEAHPTVEAIRWNQFTPYFNDGEPCTFHVHDFYRRIFGDDPHGGDYGDGFNYIGYGAKDAESEAFREFERAIKDDDIFLAVFGNHVKVTANRAGFEVEEYDHD